MKQGDHVFLADGSGYIFRAYHALPPLTRKSDGLPCGAVSGFCNMLWKLIGDADSIARRSHAAALSAPAACDNAEGKSSGKSGKPAGGSVRLPTHFAVIFDYSSQTFRKDIYPEYKANRPAPPADLIPQFSLIRDATRAFGLPCIEMEGYEADDIIAAYARKAEEAGASVTIISSDKDLMQLVNRNICLYDGMKDKTIGAAQVEEKWGVPPSQMVDFQALVGDSADNIPGVAGIGPKTAAELLRQFGSLEEILARAGEISQARRRGTLLENADKARLSQKLARLCSSVPLELDLSALAFFPPQGAELIGFLKAMEFNSLTRRAAAALDIDAAAVEPASLNVEWSDAAYGPDTAPAAGEAARASKNDKTDLFAAAKADDAEMAARAGQGGQAAAITANEAFSPYDRPLAPQALADYAAATAKAAKIDRSRYSILSEPQELEHWLERARDQGFFAFDTETTGLDPLKADLVGFSIALAAGEAAYIPLEHCAGAADLLGSAPLQPGQMAKAAALELLKPILADEAVLKIGQNIKYDMHIMAGQGAELRCIDDTMLLSYVLESGAVQSHGLDSLAKRWLNHDMIAYSDIAGSGRDTIPFAQAEIAKAAVYAAEDADVTLRLWQVLKPQLIARGLLALYEREERPLVSVLAEMERRGVLVDKVILARLSLEFSQEAAKLAEQIYALAGEEFNIGSPKQLGEILFGKFALPGGKKTKTGQWSTSAQTLDDLAVNRDLPHKGALQRQGQAVAGKIAAWRQVKKLQSTYADALPQHCDSNNRIHTNYAQAATVTGRLASSEPNLQNIPVRTKEGRQIRAAFIAPKGKLLLSADYSQIELRILAHVADIASLKKAFALGQDIHAMTASEMFHVPLAEMTAETRRRAKAINFGIIYGISAFGLANQLGIEREEAGRYIKTYFERFPGIKDYMERTKAFAREHGYVETIFGRRAHYPHIKASNPQVRAFNERAAINAPIQGAAADIIRRAMIIMEDGLREAGLMARAADKAGKAAGGGAGGDKVKMLCQVHDELIFEIDEDAAERAAPVICKIMENAAFPAVNLSVPLKVEARAAKNWNDAH